MFRALLSLPLLGLALSAVGNCQLETQPDPAGIGSCRDYLKAQLTRTIDVRKMSVGDQVLARIVHDSTVSGDLSIPKNSKLIGRIQQVRSKARGASDSRLAIIFEKIILRGGRVVPVNLRIEEIASPADGDRRLDDQTFVETKEFPSTLNTTSKHPFSGMNGIELLWDEHERAPATVLRSAGDNLRIESGALLLLRVIEQ